MSRLADAKAKLEAALQQLETALASRPATAEPAAPVSGAASSGDMVDRAAIIAEISRIDEQLSAAMQIIHGARQTSGSEGGTA